MDGIRRRRSTRILPTAQPATYAYNRLTVTTISHYRFEAEIGRGGMGVVHRAVDTKLGRQVAIKVLPAQATSDPYPQPIVAADGVIKVRFVEFASLPDLPGEAQPARMMLLVNEPGTRRLFVNDMRGPLYSLSYDGRLHFLGCRSASCKQQCYAGRQREQEPRPVHGGISR